ncbi:FAD-binding dehydrogenase [Brachybacterium endophyticum]|uniref:FAD-binding dehydrogenase n=1 Tax=Brachybacterium endophyticum TaxID=2182385 RepID=A0A2U2RP40_9MICO|nr:FAD-binding dehydrogenase [Brachybacterium endophyticum]PWH07524.1 FAD-binding dehydrogenase [Brachybacterium endophyticum]
MSAGAQRSDGTTAADAIVVGAGLAGIVAACEIADAGRSVLLIEREGEQDLGGQAHWSFGGLFLVDSPEQRRLGIRDSLALARQDWMGSARFERPEDHWPRAWAEAYLRFAAGEKRAWLHERGVRFFPVVGWAERGDGTAEGHGNSVPRFHITWGTGPGVLDPFLRRLAEHRAAGRIRVLLRHAVEELVIEGGRVIGVRGHVLAPDPTPRGVASTREVTGDFEASAGAVLLATGGIGGNPDLVREVWPQRLGRMPADVVHGVPASVDGAGMVMAREAGAHWINTDRMWHYTEGLRNWDPVWENHGIRILPGPSSLWVDARGERLPAPAFPGFDTTGTLRILRERGHDHSWFVLTRKIIEKEFVLSGSEQNPDLTGKDLRGVLGRVRPGAPAPVQAFLDRGEDFVQASDVAGLVGRMNALVGEDLVDAERLETQIRARDAEVVNRFSKDTQMTAIRGARRYLGDRLIRTASPHRLLDESAGPLIAVRLHVLLRKTLGGLETDLEGRVQRAPSAGAGGFDGLFAAGEASGFGGGGYHGNSALEGTFLGGCLFSGRQAGRGVVEELR